MMYLLTILLPKMYENTNSQHLFYVIQGSLHMLLYMEMIGVKRA